MALPVTPEQPVTKATFGLGGDMADLLVIEDFWIA
jgi:hypothetical protein